MCYVSSHNNSVKTTYPAKNNNDKKREPKKGKERKQKEKKARSDRDLHSISDRVPPACPLLALDPIAHPTFGPIKARKARDTPQSRSRMPDARRSETVVNSSRIEWPRFPPQRSGPAHSLRLSDTVRSRRRPAAAPPLCTSAPVCKIR